jgi:hypothetical protein
VVEGVGTAQRHLLLRREQELDSRVPAPLLHHSPYSLEHGHDGRFVVRAENRPGRVADDAVLPHDGLDRRFRRNRVGVGAQENGYPDAVAVRGGQTAIDVPGVAVEPGGNIVLVPGQAERGEVFAHPISHGPLLPGRARQRTELEEQIEHGERRHGAILRVLGTGKCDRVVSLRDTWWEP